MLKITKGLKKKKKGKKSKHKDQELFTEEELEQYKKEHQAQAQAHAQPQQQDDQIEEEESAKKPARANDEWSKFNALTTGVDSILKKTQGDLDRIKSTSYFQRIPPKERSKPVQADLNSDQGWVGFDENKKQNTDLEHQGESSTVPETFPEVESSEESDEDGDDIFDTSYIDVVASGDIQLAYIPESPTEDTDGPDPFDTSYADKIIKGPEVSKRGKKLVSIGSAVEVLTGRVEAVTCVKKVKRRVARDLLLQSFDDNGNVEEVTVEPIGTEPKSLLDDDVDIPENVPIDLSISLHRSQQQTESQVTKTEVIETSILDEFDVITDDALSHGIDDNDEFAQLAAESLTKTQDHFLDSSNILDCSFSSSPEVHDRRWAAFGQSDKKPPRPPPPRPKPSSQTETTAITDELGEDPFDTTFATNILPGKAELKLIESEILGLESDDFDFDPRAGEEKLKYNNREKTSVHIQITDPAGDREVISGVDDRVAETELTSLKPIHRDLLGGSTTDLSQLADIPIAPYEPGTAVDDYIEYSDPFDTSSVAQVVAPGKTELKFLEKEFLDDEINLKKSLSDPDFDPRALENLPPKVSNTPQRKQSRPDILGFSNKSVAFVLPGRHYQPDLLESGEETTKHSKPLTPYYVRTSSIASDAEEPVDPFDTSYVSNLAPNKTELKLLENELIVEKGLVHSLSDHDFNPREDINETKTQIRRHSDFTGQAKPPTSLIFKPDLLVVNEEHSIKVLTPALEQQDTTLSYSDPFDTSIASCILPGKAELKILESELLTDSNPIKRNLTDPDFDPRTLEEQVLVHPANYLPTGIDQSNGTGALFQLGDEVVEPFVASVANNWLPGTELNIL